MSVLVGRRHHVQGTKLGYLHVKELDSFRLCLDLIRQPCGVSSTRRNGWPLSNLFELCHVHGGLAFHLHQPHLIEIETESHHCAGTRVEGLTVQDDLLSVSGTIEPWNSSSERFPDDGEQQKNESHDERDMKQRSVAGYVGK